MTHEDGVQDLLGVRFQRQEEDKSLFLTQPAEYRKLEEHFFGGGETPLVLCPMHPSYRSPTAEQQKPTDVLEYQRTVGRLGYLRVTRNDARNMQSELGSRLAAPRVIDQLAAVHLAQFLFALNM